MIGRLINSNLDWKRSTLYVLPPLASEVAIMSLQGCVMFVTTCKSQNVHPNKLTSTLIADKSTFHDSNNLCCHGDVYCVCNTEYYGD